MFKSFIILGLFGLGSLAANSSDNINVMPNYNNEYEDTQGWYSWQGKIIYDQPQPVPDTPDTNNSLDSVPNNLPGTI